MSCKILVFKLAVFYRNSREKQEKESTKYWMYNYLILMRSTVWLPSPRGNPWVVNGAITISGCEASWSPHWSLGFSAATSGRLQTSGCGDKSGTGAVGGVVEQGRTVSSGLPQNPPKCKVSFWLFNWETFCFKPCCTVCRILVSRLGLNLGPLAVRAQSPNHWTFREFPQSRGFNILLLF